MTAITKLLAGGAAIAALASAAPAAAQYYPGYGNGYGGNGYGANSQALVNQCAAAVQGRLSRNNYGGYGYGGGYGGYGGARVLGISRIEPRGDGGLRIRGVATSGFNGGRPDLTFSCKTDYRGFIRDVDIDRATSNYGYGYTPYNDYSQYGYRRY